MPLISQEQLLTFGQKKYSFFIVALIIIGIPLLYFFLSFLPWETNKSGVLWSVIALLAHTILTALLVPKRFIRAVIITDIFVTVAAVSALAIFSGGILSPFNVFLIIPVAFALFLENRRFGIHILGLSVFILFLSFLMSVGAGIASRFAFFLIYLVLLIYLFFILDFLRGMLVHLEKARRKAQEKVSHLEQITEKLRQLDKLKIEFVERTSHNLRTPLNRIKWGLQTLYEEGELKGEQKEFVKSMLKSSRELIDLSGELLEVEKLEGGKLVYGKKPVAIDPIIAKIFGEYEQELKARRISINVPMVDFKVLGDERVLGLVLRNIIDNAVIYNKDGGSIKISFAENEGKLNISVEDSGIGIPKDDLPFIFKRFYRAKNAARYVADGSGLGLSLSKKALEEMGGNMSVESKEGEWTKVTIILPLI